MVFDSFLSCIIFNFNRKALLRFCCISFKTTVTFPNLFNCNGDFLRKFIYCYITHVIDLMYVSGPSIDLMYVSGPSYVCYQIYCGICVVGLILYLQLYPGYD